MRKPIVWVYNPLASELTDDIPKSLLVYHCVDDLAAVPNIPSRAIRSAERSLLAKADLVLTTSRQLQARCSECSAGKTYYFPNAADFEHFSLARRQGTIPQDLHEIARPRIGMVGAVSDYKVDFDLIAWLARARPHWQWVLIGQVGQGQPGTSINKLLLPNIHLLGARDYNSLPDYLRGFDAAALPCPLNDYTRSMFPLKFFEYLSAGKPVVATRLDALKEYSHVCRLCDWGEEFVQALDEVLSGRVPNEQLCLKEAQVNTWSRHIDQMVKLIEDQA